VSELTCPACGAPNSDLNPRCARCGAPLPEESRHTKASPDPALADTVLSSSEATVPATPPLAVPIDARPGVHLGRFTVLEELGRGSMGVVVKAHDPGLDRMVAIKILRPDGVDLLGAQEARERLLREAKAMARVSHRNVVSVHEVAIEGDQVLVVMELIQGRTLRVWLREQPRSTEEIVSAFLQAGRGLAEVHRSALVHRDFKPDNILVGADGRVCITDFGLVGLVQEQVDSKKTTWNAAEPRAPAPVLTTGTGVLMGTPAYMAPEQHQLRRADARADQFAFCVALYEALYGERPFDGGGYEKIKENVLAGVILPAPAGATVPARLRRIAVRGLAVDPAGRYPSMDALLADLEKDPRVARRRVLLGAAAAGLVGVAGYFAVQGNVRCKDGPSRLAGVWDPPVKAAVEKAFLGTGKPYAADAYQRTAKVLDERAAAWVAMYTDSCQATHVRGEQSAQLLDARTGCLDRRRTELAALVAVLGGEPGPDVVQRAVEAAYALPGLESCNREAVLSAVPLPSDPAAPPRIAAARAALAKASALLETKRSKDGLETVQSIEEEVRALAYSPLLAEWLFVRGALERETGDFNAAEATLRSAAVEAARAKNDALLARVWTLAIDVVGLRKDHYPEALSLEAAGVGAVERAGGDPLLRGKLLTNLALVQGRKGDWGPATATAQEAVALLEKLPGGEGPDLATACNAQGIIFTQQRKQKEALASNERALHIRERLFGESNRTVANSLASVAVAYASQGEPEKGLPLARRAVAIAEQILGPDHPATGNFLGNLAIILTDAGHPEEALQVQLRALDSQEKTLGPNHPHVAKTLCNVAYALEVIGRLDEAQSYLERAVAVVEKSTGPKHPDFGRDQESLGRVLCLQGQVTQGLAHVQRGIAVFEELGEKDGPDMALLLGSQGRCLLRAGQTARARASLERAVSIAAAREADLEPSEAAAVQFALAQALWHAPADRKRAVELATQARGGFSKEGGRYRKDAAEVTAWLEAHPGGGP